MHSVFIRSLGHEEETNRSPRDEEEKVNVGQPVIGNEKVFRFTGNSLFYLRSL